MAGSSRDGRSTRLSTRSGRGATSLRLGGVSVTGCSGRSRPVVAVGLRSRPTSTMSWPWRMVGRFGIGRTFRVSVIHATRSRPGRTTGSGGANEFFEAGYCRRVHSQRFSPRWISGGLPWLSVPVAPSSSASPARGDRRSTARIDAGIGRSGSRTVGGIGHLMGRSGRIALTVAGSFGVAQIPGDGLSADLVEWRERSHDERRRPHSPASRPAADGVAGLLTQAARALAEMQTDEPDDRKCRGCGSPFPPRASGRPRKWCPAPACQKASKRGGSGVSLKLGRVAKGDRKS